MKKLLSVLLSVSLLLSVFPLSNLWAKGEEVADGTAHEHGYEYECDAVCNECLHVRQVTHDMQEESCAVCGVAMGTCGDEIWWCVQDKVLILTGVGEMYHYDFWSNQVPWQSYQKDIVKIVVGEGITSLGTNAFCDCIQVTQVELPTTLKKMWMNAFAMCEKLTQITIPAGLEAIDVSAFANCTSMQEYKVAEGNTHFTAKDGVLFSADMTRLWAYPIGSKEETYQMPDSVVRVEAYAFSQAAGLKDIVFSKNLKHIDDEAFHDCYGLTAITLPEGFESTGGGAFQGCENLSVIVLPPNMTRVGPLCFDQTAYYNNLDNWEDQLVLYLDNYLLQAREEWDEVGGESDMELTGEYKVKDGTTLIADEAFDFLEDVTKVILPSSLKYIGEGAFCACDGLVEFTIPQGVTHIGEIAFFLCDNLTQVNLPQGLQRIGYDAFESTPYLSLVANAENPIGYVDNYVIGTHSSLQNANIKEGTVLIAESAFQAAGSSVKTITLPESLRYIGAEAFVNTYNTKNITVPKDVAFIGDYAFGFEKRYDNDAEEYVYSHIYKFTLSGYTGSVAETYAKKFNVPFEALDGCEHEYAATVTIPNTCTTAGEATYRCLYCEDSYTETIPAGHTNVVIDPAVAPGCNTNGLTEGKHCEACGTVIVEQLPTGSLYHNVSYEFGTDPSCGKSGLTDAIWCNDCGKYVKEPEVIPPTGNHRVFSYDEIQATCTKEGRTGGSYCGLCGQRLEEPTVVPVNDRHTKIVLDNAVPSTCTTDGKGEGTHCEDCGTVIKPQEIRPATGHKADNRDTIDKPATATQAGYKTRRCLYCKEILDIAELPPLTGLTLRETDKGIQVTWNQYSQEYVCNLYRVEVGVGADHTVKHVFTTKDAFFIDLDAKAGKTYVYSLDVQDIYYRSVASAETQPFTFVGPAKKHTYSGACDTTCNDCGEIRKTSASHTYKSYVTKATTAKNGKIVKKCSVCGRVASTTTIRYAKSFKLSATTYTYNGKVKTPTVTVKDSAGKVLKKNVDYTVTYASGRKLVGTYKVTIKMKGNYSGTKTLTFKINPAGTTLSKLTKGTKKITVAINKKATQITGYQVQYSTSKKFTNAKTKTVSSYKTTKVTLSGLKAKTTYYVRVRTYKKVGKTTYYSGWSTYKYTKTK